MSKSRKFITTAAALFAGAAALAVVSYSFVEKMVKVALDREAPEIPYVSKRRISGEENGEYYEKAAIASEELKNNSFKNVEITAHDGERLIGHFYECENAERVIIAMHGWRSSWHRDFGMISKFWHKNGCSVLYVEQRGQCNSGGEYMGFGMVERFDCLDWISKINEITESELPIYLAGISMGAATVLMASGLDLPKNVAGIMADCGYTSPHEIWKHVVKNNLHLSYGIMGVIADDMCRKKINVGSKDCSTIEALRSCRVPVLFIHGSDDRFVPVEMTYENYKVCQAPKKLLIVPGAGHGKSYLKEPERYEETVLSFWNDIENRL